MKNTGIMFIREIALSSRRTKGAFGPLDQPACFGAGCYIETVHSYHQPSEHVLVRGENGFSAKNRP